MVRSNQEYTGDGADPTYGTVFLALHVGNCYNVITPSRTI